MHQHRFVSSTKFDKYEICLDCGTYHSTALLPVDEVYINADYWDNGDGKTGRSTMEQQQQNFLCTDDCGISKADRILQFVPKRGKNVLEIAASPGVMLQKLLDMNYEVFGIEPRGEYCEYLANYAKGAKVICGYFPEATKESNDNIFDCVIGLDVAEHIDLFEPFFKEIHRILIPGGTAIIMSPILLNPDKFLRAIDMQHPEQHAWIWSEDYLKEYLGSMFSEVKFTRWVVGHEIIILKK